MGPSRRAHISRFWQNWLWIPPLILVGFATSRPSYPFGSKAIDEALDGLGLLLVLVGVAIRVCARSWKVEAKARGLVTDGLYGYVRHPIYLGSFLIGFGLCVIVGSPWLVAAYVVYFAAVHFPVIHGEEAKLARLWPSQHAAYRRTVPAFLPSLRRLRRRPVLPHDLKEAVLKDVDAVLWPVLLAIAIEIWEDVGATIHEPLTLEVVAFSMVAIFLAALWVVIKYRRIRRRRHSHAQ